MENDFWLIELYVLAERFSHLGVTQDLGLLNREELWGLYRYLRRVAGD